MKKALLLTILVISQIAAAKASMAKDPADLFKVRSPSSAADWGTPIDPVNLSLAPTKEAPVQPSPAALHWWIFTTEPQGYLRFGFGDRCNRRGGYRSCY